MLSAISVTVQICLILYVATEVFARLLLKPEAAWVRTRARPILMAAFALGMLVPNKWVLYAFVVGIIPLMARSRSQIPPIYVVAVLAVPPMSLQLAFGSFYLFEVDRYLFAGLGAAIAYLMHPAGRNRLPPAGIDLSIVILVALEMVEARGTTFTNMLRSDASIACSLILPYVVLSRSFRKPEDLGRLMLAICLCGFAMSAIGLYESRRGALPYDMVQNRIGILGTISSYSHQRAGALRATGSFVEATSFGLFVSLAFVALLPIRTMFRSKWSWRVAMGGLIVGLYSANTRAGMIALVVGVLAYDLYGRRWAAFGRKAAGIGVLGVILLVAARFSHGLAVRLGLAGDSVGTADYRKMLLTRGWEEIRKHPWFGMSTDQIYASLADLRQGEGIIDFVNAYVWYGLIAGFVGMAAFVLIFLFPATRALLNRRRLKRLPQGIELAGAVFAAALLNAITAGLSGFSTRHALIVLTMFAGFHRLVGMRSAAPRPMTPVPDPALPGAGNETVLAPT